MAASLCPTPRNVRTFAHRTTLKSPFNGVDLLAQVTVLPTPSSVPTPWWPSSGHEAAFEFYPSLTARLEPGGTAGGHDAELVGNRRRRPDLSWRQAQLRNSNQSSAAARRRPLRYSPPHLCHPYGRHLGAGGGHCHDPRSGRRHGRLLWA